MKDARLQAYGVSDNGHQEIEKGISNPVAAASQQPRRSREDPFVDEESAGESAAESDNEELIDDYEDDEFDSDEEDGDNEGNSSCETAWICVPWVFCIFLSYCHSLTGERSQFLSLDL